MFVAGSAASRLIEEVVSKAAEPIRNFSIVELLAEAELPMFVSPSNGREAVGLEQIGSGIRQRALIPPGEILQ